MTMIGDETMETWKLTSRPFWEPSRPVFSRSALSAIAAFARVASPPGGPASRAPIFPCNKFWTSSITFIMTAGTWKKSCFYFWCLILDASQLLIRDVDLWDFTSREPSSNRDDWKFFTITRATDCRSLFAILISKIRLLYEFFTIPGSLRSEYGSQVVATGRQDRGHGRVSALLGGQRGAVSQGDRVSASVESSRGRGAALLGQLTSRGLASFSSLPARHRRRKRRRPHHLHRSDAFLQVPTHTHTHTVRL